MPVSLRPGLDVQRHRAVTVAGAVQHGRVPELAMHHRVLEEVEPWTLSTFELGIGDDPWPVLVVDRVQVHQPQVELVGQGVNV